METTTIILIGIFVVCGFVFLWALKNGNGLKFAKKEKKKKAEKSKQEKYKDVVPKEKPVKKEKKPFKQKISSSAKAEKAGTQEAPSNKVVKVTKEDFQSNDMDVPKTFDTAPEKQEPPIDAQSIVKDNKFMEGLGQLSDFNFQDDMWDQGDKPLTDKEIEDFLSPMGSPFDSEQGFPPNDDFFKMDDSVSPIDPRPTEPLIDFGLNSERFAPARESKILNEGIEERFNQVFGKAAMPAGGAREVIVGEVLSENRSRTNREIRQKRLKQMFTGSKTSNE